MQPTAIGLRIHLPSESATSPVTRIIHVSVPIGIRIVGWRRVPVGRVVVRRRRGGPGGRGPIPGRAARGAPGHARERQRREGQADDVDEDRGRSVGAGEIASSTRTSKVNRSPSRCGIFSSTTASRTDAPSLLSTDTVAFGGSLAKLPALHSSSRCSVSRWPAARTGRSANTIEFGPTLVNVKVWPCRLAPREFMTISEGTMSALNIDFAGGGVLSALAVGACAKADPGTTSNAVTATSRQS
jgi:hypothetical protein